jgi:ribosomal protein S18 acetylase RimI-like enzyme
MTPTTPDPVGRRVVVRYRLPAGSQPPLTDVVGTLDAADAEALTVAGPHGPVTVRRSDVVVVKAVPPRPTRRGRPHLAVGDRDLERLTADGWRAVEEEWEGGWLLRASGGFTTRGNSVLPLGDPGLPLEEAVQRAEAWYAARGLPPQVHLVLPASGDPADDRLGSLLGRRGYTLRQPSLVMTAAAADIPALRDEASVTVEATLTRRWAQAYARQRTPVPGVTEQVLAGTAQTSFLSLSGPSGDVSAVARVTRHPGWAGLSALWVDPGQRGRGLGRTLVRATGMLARRHGRAAVYLQVEADHDLAVALYESEGFRTHHAYGYLRR